MFEPISNPPTHTTPTPGELQPFVYPTSGQQVRTLTIDGVPWFVAKDACDVIGITKHRDAVAQLDKDERASAAVDTPGGRQQMTLVNEAGLYALMMISRSEKVKPFRRWVTHDVLPAIRQTGSYSAAPDITTPEGVLALAEMAAGTARELIATRATLAEVAPKAEHWEVLASAEGDLAVADAAKILSRDPAIKTGRDRLFRTLGELGWAYRQRGDNKWRSYQRAVERGWLSELPQTHYNPRTGILEEDAPQVRVTNKGLAELRVRLGGAAELPIPV